MSACLGFSSEVICKDQEVKLQKASPPVCGCHSGSWLSEIRRCGSVVLTKFACASVSATRLRKYMPRDGEEDKSAPAPEDIGYDIDAMTYEVSVYPCCECAEGYGLGW